MIFTFFFIFYWLVQSNSIYMLAVPLISSIMRTCFLNRKINITLVAYSFLTFLLFLLFFLVTNHKFFEAIFQAGRIFISSLLLIQIIDGFKNESPSYPIIGTFIIVSGRSITLVTEMMKSLKYSFLERKRFIKFSNEKRRLKGVINLIFAFITCAASNFMELSKNMQLLHKKRKNFNNKMTWIKLDRSVYKVLLGDLVFILLLMFFIMTFKSDTPFVPDAIKEFADKILNYV